jgi:RHS repeat-associated protein
MLHQKRTTTLDGAIYTYDYAGNRQTNLNSFHGITSTYGYDAIYELNLVTQGTSTTESYSYDAVGNRRSSLGVTPYTYNASNELASTPSGSYGYDNDGNTLTDASGRSYTWDFENRMVSAVVPGTGTVTFKYDPFGRRIQKSGPLGTTNYLYEGANAMQEIDNSGNVFARYTQAGGIDEPLSLVRGGTTAYYEQDGLGSVTSLTGATGALANSYTFDSFGKLTASTGALANPFQFTGRDFDSETGINFYRARYFDQNIGRFVSEDPIKFMGGINFYRYASNSPTNLTDPAGLAAGAAPAPGPGPMTFSLEPWAIGYLAYYDWQLFWLEINMLQEWHQRDCAKNRGCTCTAKCTCHEIGTPDHANTGTWVFGSATASNCSAARTYAKVNAGLGCPAGSHAQHCSYQCNLR